MQGLASESLRGRKTVLKVMPKLSFAFLLALSGLFGARVQPILGQALLPPLPEPAIENFERSGILLGQETLQVTLARPDDRFDWEWALPRLQVATELAPNSPQTWLFLGSVHLELQQAPEAIVALEKSLAFAPDNTGVRFTLGSAYFLDGRYTDAVDILEKGLRDDPDALNARFDLGNAYLKLARYDEAIAAYEEAFAKEATFWPAINNVGLVLYERGDIAGAVERWQTALTIDNAAAEPQLAIAAANFIRGETEEALSLGVTALENDVRYADLDFLAENLWGERLLADVAQLLAHPRLQEIVARSQREAAADDAL